MKPMSVVVAALSLAAGVMAVDIKKQVVITYESSTPDWVLRDAKATIVAAGGVITHEYNLIKGFAATAGDKVLATVKTMGSQYQALIEEDKVVSAN